MEEKMEQRYKNIHEWFLVHPKQLICLRFLYRLLPLVMAAGYVICLLISAMLNIETLLFNIFVPAAAFVVVTIFRAAVNCPRPYEVFQLPPLVKKDKTGHSFPSRHAASAGVIAMAWWRINIPAGILFLFIAVIIAGTRVLAGVHFVRDAAAGLMFGVGAGIVSLMIF